MMPTVSLVCPDNCHAERRYVFDIVFKDWLGLDWSLEFSETRHVRVNLANSKAALILPDVLFSGKGSAWRYDSVVEKINKTFLVGPDQLANTPTGTASLPVIFSLPEGVRADAELPKDTPEIRSPVDIFGTIFFMLSGMDGHLSSARDHYGRFPGTASVAFECSLIERPIVDEYVELLCRYFEQLSPGLTTFCAKGGVKVTCDVDQPLDPHARSAARLIRGAGDALVKGKSLAHYNYLVRNYLSSRAGDHSLDRNNTFRWYMDTCEKYSRSPTFFFIADRTAGSIDGHYDLTDVFITELMREIVSRGHNVGVHGSFNSTESYQQVEKERELMQSALRNAEIAFSLERNRQHYLRWDDSTTPFYLDKAGYQYDFTGGYADAPGFRYGTAKTFKMWSWETMESLKLVQQPLIVMESSIISKKYLGLGYTSEALDKMLELKHLSLKYGGDFTFLWHNSHLETEKDREFFKALLG